MTKWQLFLLAVGAFCSMGFIGSPAESITPVERVEREIVRADYEIGVVLDAAGSVVWRSDSQSATHVFFPDSMLDSVAGLTFTHNHPDPASWTFSYDDIRFAARTNIGQMRVVSGRGLCVADRAGGAWVLLPPGGIEYSHATLHRAWQELLGAWGIQYWCRLKPR